MTGLYQTMVRRLWRKDAERLQKELGITLAPRQIQRLPPYQIDKLMATVSEYLGFLAFKGIHDHQIEFDESTLLNAMEELDKPREMANQEHMPYQLIDTLKQTSFLHTADAELGTSKDDSQRAWYFLHLTFQEYFAATWIVRRFQTEQNIDSPLATLEGTKAYIQEHKYNPRYQIVWWMVAGMLRGEARALFFKLLQGMPVDLIGGYHHHLLAGCLNEGRNQLHDKSVENVEIQLGQWLRFEMAVNGNSDGRSALGGMSYFPEELLIRSIGQSGAPQSYLIMTLAMRALLTQSSIAVLVNGLQDAQGQNWRQRKTIIETLGKQSTFSESILQALIGALQDKSLDVRESAALVLEKQPSLTESTLQALLGALQGNNREARKSASLVLGGRLTLPGSTLQALVNALQDESEDVREPAAEVLQMQSTLPESILQALVDASQDESWDVRITVAKVLGKQSTLPESTLRALVDALQDESWDVRESAVIALGKQSALPESTLQALVGALYHKSWDIRRSAADAFIKQSTLPVPIIHALIGVLQDKNKELWEHVVSVLERHIKSAFMAIPSLSPFAIESLYRSFLINYCSKYPASLWVQGHRFLFCTAQDYGGIDGVNTEDVTKVVGAFDMVRKGAGAPLIKER
ncbi:hypothetical protein BGX21_011369 [Mortierella sp. AD011]|nr:hypothetical protein BGX20_011335 [Mortierella sp. AD010]KAF9390841.1 hypothetical protein BGX21_011369 [Mortierella sp. AD011]